MLWIRTAFRHSWDRAQSVGTGVIIVAALIARWFPVYHVTDTAIIGTVFGLIILARLLLSPYWIYRDLHAERSLALSEIQKLKTELANDTEQKRKAESKARLKDTIVIQLSRLMDMGEKILIKARSFDAKPEVQTEADTWYAKTEEFCSGRHW